MNLKRVVAISVLAVTPAAAQGPTKADAHKVVQSINSDKGKLQTYCDISKLSQQMVAADERKDTKALQVLGPKLGALADKLGSDYVKLMDGLDQVDENSPEGKEIAAAFDQLGKQCK